MHATEQRNDALHWPCLSLSEDEQASACATPLARQVCEALERRLERLAAFQLPAQVTEDMMDMWRNLDDVQRLLADAPADERRPGRAQRLLADLQAWLPVCETWIGRARSEPVPWPALA